MKESEPPPIDWVHLPMGIDEISMWGCLHDGELKSCSSDLLEGSVELEFIVNHLLDDQEKEKNVSFSIRIQGVSSVRVDGHFLPLDKYEEPTDLSNEDQKQLRAEYYSKWREESLCWRDFEAALITDSLQIMDATLVSDANETTLRLGGFLDGEKFHDIYADVFVRGRELSASRSDGIDFGIDAFIKLGNQYWNNLGD
jgi:hypothetical protein